MQASDLPEAARQKPQISSDSDGRCSTTSGGSGLDEIQKAAPWRALFTFTTRAHIPLVVAGAFVSLIAGAAEPATILMTGELLTLFTEFGAGGRPKDEFLHQTSKYVLYITAISAGSWLFHSLEFMIWLAFGELQAKSARDRLFHGLLEKEISWYDMRKNGIGALLPRIQAQTRELQLATAQPLGSLFSLFATAVLSLIQAFFKSWDLTLVTLSTVPLILVLAVLVGRGMQTNLEKQQDKLTEAQKFSTNAFTSIETVKCFNGQEIELNKYKESINAAAGCYAWVAKSAALQLAMVMLLSISMFVQGFYYGSLLVARGKIAPGDVVTTFFSAITAFQAIQGILPQMIVFEKGRTAGSTLRTIMAQIQNTATIKRTRGLLVPAICSGNIDVQDVSFAYPSRADQLAIKNVTLYIQGGELTFLIGKSGSGKSTISQLLMRFYEASEGQILIDNIPLEKLDAEWLRSNITLVEQQSLLFNDSVFQNIALGSKNYANVTREEAMEAADFALLQLMINDMPNGLDTEVGFKGGSMSGGQRQRMALARARLRDTPILILDESTSALDYISRTLMMEAIRRWRFGKTTIIITHDISQILPEDYIYLLESGMLVQEGYRKYMERMQDSPFQGFLSEEQRTKVRFEEDGEDANRDSVESKAKTSPGSSSAHIRNSSEYELDPLEMALNVTEERAARRTSYLPRALASGTPVVGMRAYGAPGPSSVSGTPWMRLATSPVMDWAARSPKQLHPVDAVNVSSPGTDRTPDSASRRWSQVLEKLIDQTGKRAADMRKTAVAPRRRRPAGDSMTAPLTGSDASLVTDLEASGQLGKPVRMNSLKYIFSTLWPSLTPSGKMLLIVGFWGASIHAISSPLFSYILSRLLNTFSIPGGDKTAAIRYSLIILGIAVADASHTWIFRFLHEYTSQLWVDKIRYDAFECIMDQSREFFEREENGVSQLTGNLDRNAEEMRNLLGRFASLAYVAFLMISVSIAWAMVAQWKMTLISLAMAPFIFGVTKAYARISEKWESRSNDASDEAAAIFTETFTNIKTVRALTLEDHFLGKYIKATEHSLRVGFQRAFYAGFFFGISDASGKFGIALVFYVGAKLAAGGAKVGDIVQVFTMLIFLIGQVTNILDYVPQIGSSKDTASRLLRLARLPKDSHEHLGDTRVTTVGDIVFNNLIFAYPSRPEQNVLNGINLRLQPGTATAIVGGSGSGKSTISNLLMDMYSTASTAHGGDLTFGGRDMKHVYTPSLRALIVPVSQTPTLFAANISENIAYGLPPDSPDRTPASIETAARQSGIHDFIASLPAGYATVIGDGGMGLSGGQSQRIAIARALVRKPSVLILDEATSALDVESANLIRQTIRALVANRSRALTVVIITHHRDMMEVAERVVVLDQGRIAEEGSFVELVAKKGGALADLLNGGEWDANLERGGGADGRRVSKVPMLKGVDWNRKAQNRRGK